MPDNFVPVKDKIAVLIDSQTRTTPAGIHLPDIAQKPVLSGRIVAVGPECLLASTMDRIMITPYHTGVEIEINETKILVIQEKDVLGIVRFVQPENVN